MGTGASLINEPFPLLNFSPSLVYSFCSLKNSPIEIEILPPNPIEWGLPPLLSPCSSHIVNIYRIWMGSNSKFLRSRESAMHKAILQSSVQIPTFPDRASRTLLWIWLFTSWKSLLIRFLLFLSNGMNSVEAPKASQIANPRKEAIALDSFSLRLRTDGSNFPYDTIYLRIGENLVLSESSGEIMLNTL